MAMIAETAEWSQSAAGVDRGAAGRRGPDLSLSSFQCSSSFWLNNNVKTTGAKKRNADLGDEMLKFYVFQL